MIVDSQVHVWKASTPDRPWSYDTPHLERPFGYDDLLAEMNAAGVDGAILVPPGLEGDRIDFVLEATRRHPDKFGAMGRIPVQDPASIALLRDYGVRTVVVLRDRVPGTPWASAPDAPIDGLGITRIEIDQAVVFSLE